MKQQMFNVWQCMNKTEIGILPENNILFQDYYRLLKAQCKQEMIHTMVL